MKKEKKLICPFQLLIGIISFITLLLRSGFSFLFYTKKSYLFRVDKEITFFGGFMIGSVILVSLWCIVRIVRWLRDWIENMEEQPCFFSKNRKQHFLIRHNFFTTFFISLKLLSLMACYIQFFFRIQFSVSTLILHEKFIIFISLQGKTFV